MNYVTPDDRYEEKEIIDFTNICFLLIRYLVIHNIRILFEIMRVYYIYFQINLYSIYRNIDWIFSNIFHLQTNKLEDAYLSVNKSKSIYW